MLDKPVMSFHVASAILFLLGAGCMLIGAILFSDPEIPEPTNLVVEIEFDTEVQK